MACNKCTIAYGEFTPKHLTEEQRLTCDSCNKAIALINKHGLESVQCYLKDIEIWLAQRTAIKSGEKIIAVNWDLMKGINRIEHDNLIAEVVLRLGYEDEEFTGRDEINLLCGNVVGLLIDDLKNHIKFNSKGYLVSLMTMLEQNTYLSITTINWFRNDYKNKALFQGQNNHEVGNALIETFSLLSVTDDRKFRTIYREFEELIASDKQALQLAIEIVSDHQNANDFPVQNSALDAERLLQYARAIYQVLHMRDEANEKILSLNKIYCDSKGNIEVIREEDSITQYENFKSLFFELFPSPNGVGDLYESSEQDFDELCLKYFGITHKQIAQLGESLFNFYPKTDLFLIGSNEYFQKLINYSIGIEVKETFLNMFIRDATSKTNYNIGSKARPLRKCLIPIGENIFICPVSIFIFSVSGTYLDILNGGVDLKPLDDELQNVYKKVNTQFEKKVAEQLKVHLSPAVVPSIPQKIPKFGGKGFVFLPRELDVVMLYNQQLFILECKNLDMKFTPKSLGNEIQRIRKKFSGKMAQNIEAVKENWESVLQYLGENPNDINRHEPVGVIVTRELTISSVITGVDYPVVPYAKLVESIETFINTMTWK